MLRPTSAERARRHATRRALPFILFSAFSVAARAQDRASDPSALRVSQTLEVRTFADRQQIAFSPDGALIAFATKDPQRAAVMAISDSSIRFTPSGIPVSARAVDVFIADVRSGKTRNLTSGLGSSWAPAWSPDGRWLAFYSDRDGTARLWLWNRQENTLRRAAEAQVHVFFGFEAPQWAPDSKHVLIKLLPNGVAPNEARRLAGETTRAASASSRSRATSTATVFTSRTVSPAADSMPAQNIDSTPSFFNAANADLSLIDVSTRAVRRIVPGVRPLAYRFAPDGRRIAFSTRQPFAADGQMSYGLYDLWIADISGANVRRLVSRMAQSYGLNFSWSPDGQRLAYTSRGRVHLVGLRTGADSVSKGDGGGGPDFENEYRAPLWLGDSAVLLAASDTVWRIRLEDGAAIPAGIPLGKQLIEIVLPAESQRIVDKAAQVIVLTRDGASKRMGFQRIDLASGRATALYEADVAIEGEPQMLRASADGRAIAFVSQSASRPQDLWIATGDFTEPRRLTALNAAVGGIALGESRLIDWRGANGEQLSGALLLPAGYVAGKRYPLVVRVYGSSRLSNAVNRFGLEGGVYNLQLLATRGYAVLLPDAPQRVGTPLADLASTVLPGVDAVVAMGIADSTRLAVMGHSYGGYSVFALLVQSARFKAAISSAGFTDLFVHYVAMRDDGSSIGIGWSEEGQGKMGGTPWAYRDRYIENSPFFALDRVSTPVLLLHGSDDSTVPAARAGETFAALKRLGKVATYVRYEGEDHAPGSWSLANATDYWERIFAWFREHLGPVTPSEGR